MNVCDNLGDHLVGNVYVKFKKEEDAEKAVNDLNNRWFGGRPIYAELTPVTDFREACCRQYETGECTRLVGHFLLTGAKLYTINTTFVKTLILYPKNPENFLCK